MGRSWTTTLALARSLPEFICYLSHLKMIEEVFDDYDTNEDGLDKEELKGGEHCMAGHDASSPAHHLLVTCSRSASSLCARFHVVADMPGLWRLVLTQLNDGHTVSNELVDEVMREADGTEDGRVSKLELGRAIAVWYAQMLPSGLTSRPPSPCRSPRLLTRRHLAHSYPGRRACSMLYARPPIHQCWASRCRGSHA